MIQLGEARGIIRCPYCRDPLASLPEQHCSDCGVGYHRSCGEELGVCATVGCNGSLGQAPRGSSCEHCLEALGEARARECRACALRFHLSCAQEVGRCSCGVALGAPVVFRGQPSRAVDWSVWAPALMVGGGMLLFPLGLWAVLNVRTSTLDRVAPYVTAAPLVALVVVALAGMLFKAIRGRD